MLPRCIAFVALAAVAYAVDIPVTTVASTQCQEGEVFAKCHNQFPPTCVMKQPQSFPVPCKPGCNCKDGFIRESSDASAKCVPLNNCPSPTGGPVKCGPNEVEKDCATPAACAATCQNLKGTQPCTEKCQRGCECKPGFVRQQAGNVCVKQQDCAFVTGLPGQTTVGVALTTGAEALTTGLPQASTTGGGSGSDEKKECKPNETRKHKKQCPKTPACEPQCVQGKVKKTKCGGNSCNPKSRCECNEGYIRQMDHGEQICISEADCQFNKGPQRP